MGVNALAYDEGVAQRLRECLDTRDDVVEKKMFGGIAFMLSGNMCCGVVKDGLMARVGPDFYEQALALPHAREMDFTGRPLKGFIYIEPEGFSSDQDLNRWIDRCVQFVNGLPVKQ